MPTLALSTSIVQDHFPRFVRQAVPSKLAMCPGFSRSVQGLLGIYWRFWGVIKYTSRTDCIEKMAMTDEMPRPRQAPGVLGWKTMSETPETTLSVPYTGEGSQNPVVPSCASIPLGHSYSFELEYLP